MAAEQPEPVIKVEDIRKTYGQTVAVDGLSFDVYESEVFGLLGPNGAGKTVTVEMLQGLRMPTAGSATVLGSDIEANPHEVKAQIGVVPQSFHTFERLTVRENIRLIHDFYSEPLPVDEVIDHLDLGEYASESFASLSGGYRRRTGIAMAMVSDPKILFLDEPTAGLDPAARRDTWEQIQRVTDLGTTVVLTTHYMDEIEYLADRVALLVDGQLEALDSVAALVDQYAPSVKVIVRVSDDSDTSDTEQLESILADTAHDVYRNETDDIVGVFDDRQTAQDAFSTLHDAGTERAIELVSAGMEDVFLELAGGTLDAAGELR